MWVVQCFAGLGGFEAGFKMLVFCGLELRLLGLRFQLLSLRLCLLDSELLELDGKGRLLLLLGLR